MTSQFMDVKQTAEYLNVSVQWLYREASTVGLRKYRFGTGRNAKIQFDVDEVRRWVKHRTV
ncbi:helix-turn-helix domain-containing protein [Streptomyces sulphureus]|uniref:helix-turn-helix domain-containing protein n=1 Tax=Streptomyces sulphureus TaxID=47758 RepID=UPI00037AB03E